MTNLSKLIDTKIGRYKIIERLGSGGMATVFKAQDSNLDRFVAVKVLHGHLAYEHGFKERFEQEAKFIASFNHPNIVQVYDFDVLERDGESIYYMVMPLIMGKALDTVLDEYRNRDKLMSQSRIKQIMLDLCAALSYAHERGMVHRDVKPSNVLFDENDRAILTDFGIAKLARRSGLTQEGMIVGTPAYMAPEQATGATVDGRSDLYALGVILFELLTGQTPFTDDGTVSVLLKHVQTTPPHVSEITKMPNKALDVLVARALAKDPFDRYQTGDEFAKDIRRTFQEDNATLIETIPSSTVILPPPSTRGTGVVAPTNTRDRTSVTILRTINATVIQPARQNPLAFVAVGIALVALLIVARISNQTLAPNPLIVSTNTPTTITGAVDSMTSSAVFGISNFDDADVMNAEWPQVCDGSIQCEIKDGKYLLSNVGTSSAMATLFNPAHKYDNLRITMDAKLLDGSNPTSGYGIVFRYHDSDNYNVFAVDGTGRFSIWTRSNGTWKELRSVGENWSPSKVIMPMGRSNIVTINVYDNTFTGYVNGTQLVLLTDDTFADGNIGIYTATSSTGSALVSIESITIGEGENPVKSMTEDSQVESMTSDATPEATPTP